MRKREWTEAHRREALRRTYEIAAGFAGAGHDAAAAWIRSALGWVDSEAHWREALGLASVDPARIDREVRRVRALAEGRLVREVTWRGESGEESTDRAMAAADKSHGGARFARITRIRKATKKAGQ
jgi:hypothetical protein